MCSIRCPTFDSWPLKCCCRVTFDFVYSPRSMLAPSGPIFWRHGMGRLAGTHHEMTEAPSQIRMFYDVASALSWLGFEGDLKSDFGDSAAARNERRESR
jgi:hypothetical protein